jgi:hypothetical protein
MTREYQGAQRFYTFTHDTTPEIGSKKAEIADVLKPQR